MQEDHPRREDTHPIIDKSTAKGNSYRVCIIVTPPKRTIILYFCCQPRMPHIGPHICTSLLLGILHCFLLIGPRLRCPCIAQLCPCARASAAVARSIACHATAAAPITASNESVHFSGVPMHQSVYGQPMHQSVYGQPMHQNCIDPSSNMKHMSHIWIRFDVFYWSIRNVAPERREKH